MAGSEFTLAVMLARFSLPSAYITRVPDNPYGRLLRDTERAQGVNTDYFAWAPRSFTHQGSASGLPGRT